MFHSTRGFQRITASQAIEKGLADDGGLYVLDRIPNISYLSLLNASYQELAKAIMKPFLDNYSDDEVAFAVRNAYDERFTTPDVVKLVKTNKCHYLETWHGATFAFKDVALSVLPELLTLAKDKNEYTKQTVILTATSGDTGSAALAGFTKSGAGMFVFYPYGGVSEIQKRQMLSFSHGPRHAIALKGNFDDCQNFVKKIFADQELRESLSEIELSSANSINIGRLIPQIVYYYYSYIHMVKEGVINVDDKINFVVPTGNFGDVLAGYLAKNMGLPINKLIVAADCNNVLAEFFATGIYDKNRKFVKTISPSMDILISSNLERLLYHITLSTDRVNELMSSLKNTGRFVLKGEERALLKDFAADWASEDETKKAIHETFKNEGYLIDPHTAVARSVYDKYTRKTRDNTPTVIISTASPYKFSPAMVDSLNLFKFKEEFKNIEEIEKETGVKVPEALKALQSLDKQEEVWTLEEAEEKLKAALKAF